MRRGVPLGSCVYILYYESTLDTVCGNTPRVRYTELSVCCVSLLSL